MAVRYRRPHHRHPRNDPAARLGELFRDAVPVLGIILGFLSSHTSGRTFCIIVTILAIIRLTLGGGIL